MENKANVAIKTVEHSIPLDVLDDLCSRFIINVPDDAKQNLIRVCFQIELAHWFYLDFYCTSDNPKNKTCGLQEFAAHIFQHLPYLKPVAEDVDSVLEDWRKYKQVVPTYGAILVSDDLTHVLLVQSYWAKNSWGFPKGKINEDEKDTNCAIREVLEETGFDISDLIDENEYIDTVLHDQYIKLFIINGIKRKTVFQPRTRCEIKSCDWFALSDLPTSRKDYTPKAKIGVGPNSFFMVLPFIKRLRRWVQEKNRPNNTGSTQGKRSRNKSESDKKGGKNKDDSARQKSNGSPLRSGKKSEKKPNFKRQLFANDNKNETFDFVAPAWTNFKLNRKILLECCP